MYMCIYIYVVYIHIYKLKKKIFLFSLYAYVYVCTPKDLKVLQCTYKYIKYLKYIADYLSVSTSTFLNIELNLSTSTAKTVIKCT